MSIRYYNKEFPLERDVLIVRITEILDGGARAESLEYPNLHIYILPTEIAKYKTNLHKLFSPTKLYPVYIMNIYPQKNIADVSYKKITEEDREKYCERFSVYQKIYELGH